MKDCYPINSSNIHKGCIKGKKKTKDSSYEQQCDSSTVVLRLVAGEETTRRIIPGFLSRKGINTRGSDVENLYKGIDFSDPMKSTQDLANSPCGKKTTT